MFHGRIQGHRSGLEKSNLYTSDPQTQNSMCRERDGRTGLLAMIPVKPTLLRLRLRSQVTLENTSILKLALLFASVPLQVTFS